MDLGDQYRQEWKKRVKLRGQNIKNNVPSGSLRIPGKNEEISTTLYVPASENSVLFEEIMKTEELVGAELDWGVKIIEKCGTPPIVSVYEKISYSRWLSPREKVCRI